MCIQMLSKVKSCHSGSVFINHWQMIANVLRSQHLKWLISSTLTYKAICSNYAEYMTLSSLKHWHIYHICRSQLSPFCTNLEAVKILWEKMESGDDLLGIMKLEHQFVCNSFQNSLMQSEDTGDSTVHFYLSSFPPISFKKKLSNFLSQLVCVEFSKTLWNSNISFSGKSSQQLSDPFILTHKCTYISIIYMSGPA